MKRPKESACLDQRYTITINATGNFDLIIFLLDPIKLLQLYNCVYQYISFHFLNHSKETNQDPVNAASFGKLIRSVFLGLRTRRIGTRGNSKYHYYGIRVKPTSSLNQFDNEGSPSQGILIDIRLIWQLYAYKKYLI